MTSLLACTRPSTACAAPLLTLNTDPLGALIVASVLCTIQSKCHLSGCSFQWRNSRYDTEYHNTLDDCTTPACEVQRAQELGMAPLD